MATPSLVILGAGLQGVCAALALSRRGIPSILLEKRHEPLRAASLRNEGKIHLGFVYAMDQNHGTRDMMMRGALSFAPLLESWCGSIPWSQWRSAGFHYAVMPESLLTPEEIEVSYTQLTGQLDGNDMPKGYLGTKLDWLWRPSRTPFAASTACYETQEVSIDPRAMTEFLRAKLYADPNIKVITNAQVVAAEQRGCGFDVITERHGAFTCDAVVNCTWEDRHRIDAMVGILDGGETCYRIKYQILVRPKQIGSLVPVTMVQGPFGDIVPWNDGSVYISWYPIGRTYFSSLPPTEQKDDPALAFQIAQASLRVMSGYFPDLRDAEIISSLPGIIVASGGNDVDQRDSGLHQRDRIGPKRQGMWWTIDTGKLTTAPLFADQAVREIVDIFR
jgi:glycine/D-amino acid oxidase-like deaminating enzyme